ncbi:MAG: hypothetical protein P8L24_06260 [Cytophagales bacterium]|nr:hypothetical protein [Cytophagales bacterium]
MRHLILFVLFILLSCSSTENNTFSGDWKLVNLFRDNEAIPSLEGPTIISSFRSDNLVFYYNALMYYKVQNDSLFLYDEQTNELGRAFKYEFMDDGMLSLKFNRKLKSDSVKIINITYESIWSKVD